MIVTFDFDDTLLMTRPDEDAGIVEDGPNEENIAKMRAFLDAGHEVHIVTTRFRRQENTPDVDPWGRRDTSVRSFLRDHDLLDRVAGIHFTEGVVKTDTLRRVGSQMHFDDDDVELANLPESCEGVLVPTPLWD